jgi:hypothetical protein
MLMIRWVCSKGRGKAFPCCVLPQQQMHPTPDQVVAMMHAVLQQGSVMQAGASDCTAVPPVQ